jgi:hypothetical protein
VSSTTATVLRPKAASSPAQLLRLVFSFPVALACLLLPLTVLTLRFRFSDPDMWWHLKTGQVIWTTHTIPRVDLFSYTTNRHAWVPHEWLAQVIIYGAYQLGGYRGLMLFLCAASAALFVAGYCLCCLYSGNAKVSLLGALTIWFFATSGLAIRPQLIGYLLLIVELLIIHLGSTRTPRWFFCLPLLFAVWVNCHGSFFLGIIVGCLMYACSFITFEGAGFLAAPWTPKARQTCGLALILSAATLFANPVGLHQVLYPLETLLSPNLNLIQEFQPLDLTSARGVGLLAVLVGIFFLGVSRYATLYWHELLLLAAGTWLALSHKRMVFVFGILAAPVVSRLLSSSWDRYEREHDRPIANAILILAALLIAIAAFPSRALLLEQVRKNNPEGAVEYINTHHLAGHMLNEWVYGGYLIWAAPEHPVFIDGRGDVFAWTGVLGDFEKWATLESDPRELLEKYGIDFCLISRDSPMARVLTLIGWRPIYSDELSVIFTRPRSEATTRESPSRQHATKSGIP